ncbi:transferase hexapeptide repeat protein [Leptospira borgpetersenii serovar Pomona str. 200901868]|uniref:Transferase hexapeptide repeat protein n=1 Tax=Leptospira borgpetersenii serovar Pomona str. 200901868 TaxID=1192866 RepID=M6W571_LEPBO|nr:transferase hexapeptide repeat protein [Leptospira borgpetersenii serovar Pomona str. 200901868]
MKKAYDSGLELINAIHPSTLLLKECLLGKNIIIHPRSTIGYRAEIDDGVIVNIGTQIDHHCKIEKAVTIDPGVTLAGNVLIENFCTIHTRAVIINRIKIGSNSIIGAGTVIIRDIEPNSKVVGVPGKKLKRLFRQNGAPSGLEKRGFDASINHKTRKPTEGTQSCPFRGLMTDELRFARSRRRTERNGGVITSRI